MYICNMNKNLDDLTPEEVLVFNDKLNEDFNYFIKAFENIELGDTTDGVLIKLRAMPRQLPVCGEYFSMADIFFDLQWRLHIHKKNYPTITKMIVSGLHLLPKLVGTAFPRGVVIKIKFI